MKKNYNTNVCKNGSLSREPLLKGRLSTVDLLVLTSLYQMLLIMQTLFTFFNKTSYLEEEVNCTESSPSVRVPSISNQCYICLGSLCIGINSINSLWYHYAQGAKASTTKSTVTSLLCDGNTVIFANVNELHLNNLGKFFKICWKNSSTLVIILLVRES